MKTVKEAMKGKKDSLPLMKSLGEVLKNSSNRKDLKALKIKLKFKGGE